MNDWQDYQRLRPTPDEDAGITQDSLTIAKFIWGSAFISVLACFALYRTSWAALFLFGMLLFALMKFVPIVAAVGMCIGFAELKRQNARHARLGIALNGLAFIGATISFLLNRS